MLAHRYWQMVSPLNWVTMLDEARTYHYMIDAAVVGLVAEFIVGWRLQ